MTIALSRCSIDGSVPLKSKRVATSRRAWSTALVSSAGSNWETTSNEYSCATLPLLRGMNDAEHPDHARRRGQPQHQHGAAAQQEGDAQIGALDRLRAGAQLVRRERHRVV